MSKLVVVQCGDRKIWKNNPDIGRVKAEEAYTSPYFKKNRKYAERFGDRWVVLSAKYGFLDPDELIEDYNVTFKRKKSGPITSSDLQKQVTERELDHFDEVIVLGGKEYLDAIKEAFIDTSCKIISPFEGLTIGMRMSKINEALQETC